MRYFLFVLLLSGCATHHYETDRSDPNYQTGRNAPLLSSPPNPVDASHADPRYTPQGNTTGETAVIGLLASGVSLAAQRDYYRRVAVTGRCVCRSAARDTLEVPCPNAEVVLSDLHGKELARVEAQDGEFAFQVPAKAQYRLHANVRQYRMEPEWSKPVELGDDVVLHLRRGK